MKISLLLVLLSFVSFSNEIQIISVDYPPYMDEASPDEGMAPRFIRSAMQGSGADIKIDFYPTKRALKQFLETESLILATFRVLPPGKYKMLPITRVKSSIFAKSHQKSLNLIGYERGLFRLKNLLKARGYTPTEMVSYPAGIKMLMANRIDGIQGVELTMRYFLSKEKNVNNILTRGPHSYEDYAGLIVKEEDAHLLKALQKGFEKLQKKGEDHKLLEPDLKKFSNNDMDFYLLKDYSIKSNEE